MTVREYNQIRRTAYDAACEIADVAAAIKASGNVYIAELEQGSAHELLVLTHKTQLNDNTLREHGFAPDACVARLVLKLDRQTKCATFCGGGRR